ncbi:hypothetical protein LCGC14_3090120 [marine sediment metagenome]|uniref:Uncharacterized protein n=1 Tax=marine sediment metagenome TaxID=412755 RepID=A0A0F8Z1B7_9ZZZZ
MAKNKTMWLILGALGIGGLILLLRKPKVSARAGVPTRAGVLGVPAVAPTVAPTTIQGKLIAIASQQTGLPESELTVRSLLPLDVGLATWSFNLTAVGGWNTVAAGNVASDRFIAITGVSYSGTVAEQIRISAASSTVAYFSIQHVPGITTTHHMDISPIIVQQNQPVIIEVYSSAAAGTDEVILEGMTVEPRGRLLA